MVLPSGSKGRVIEACDYEFKAVEGRGRGLFLTEDVKAGHTILLEEPAVIGPKQMSPLVRLWKGMSIILDGIWFGITGLCGVPCGHANLRGLQILH